MPLLRLSLFSYSSADLKEIWGREIGLVGIWYLDFNYYVQLEGVLAARTLYGDPNILEEMRAKSEGHLRQAETRMTEATRAIERLHRSLESAGSFEVRQPAGPVSD